MIKTEKIIFQGRLHWIIFALPFLVFLLGIWLYLDGRMYLPGLSFLFISLVWGGHSLLNYLFSSIQVTERFLMIQTGIFVRKTLNFSVQQLESVDIIQNLLGCILNYGSLSVRGTGGTYGFFGPMASPLTCRRFLESMPRDE